MVYCGKYFVMVLKFKFYIIIWVYYGYSVLFVCNFFILEE